MIVVSEVNVVVSIVFFLCILIFLDLIAPPLISHLLTLLWIIFIIIMIYFYIKDKKKENKKVKKG